MLRARAGICLQDSVADINLVAVDIARQHVDAAGLADQRRDLEENSRLLMKTNSASARIAGQASLSEMRIIICRMDAPAMRAAFSGMRSPFRYAKSESMSWKRSNRT
jgi:Ni,Fe-hydrogenase III large subunit